MTVSFPGPGMRLAAGALALGILSAAPARGLDLEVSGGLTNVWAHELVWNGSHQDSQLDWETLGAYVVSAAVKVPVGGGFRVGITGEYGLAGDGIMTDYDWIFAGHTDWSHRSISPDTRLDQLWSVGLRTEAPVAEFRWGPAGVRFSAGLAAEYRQVQWTAYGGSYIYSDTTFRDTVGSWADGTKGITYRQSVPVGSVLLGGEFFWDAWSLALEGSAGCCAGLQDVDSHWMTDVRYADSMAPAPAFGGSVSLGAPLGGGWALFAQARGLQVLRARGGMQSVVISTGAAHGSDPAGAGADQLSLTAAAGIRAVF